MEFRFSAIITVYNGEEFIFKAIESVKNQTYSNFELIIVNNGSNDNTHEIVNEFIKENKQIVVNYIVLPINKGISGGRNVGIYKAKGEYICFLDADDIWYPEKLYVLDKSISENSEFDVFWHWEDHFDGSKIKIAKYRNINNSDLYKDLLLKGNCLSTSATVVKRQALLNINGFNIQLISGEEDYDCWLRLASVGYKFLLIEKVLGQFLNRQNSVSASYKKHYYGIINLVVDHFSKLKKQENITFFHFRIRMIKAKYLFSLGRNLSISNSKKEAFTTYTHALKQNPFYVKIYVGILFLIIGK